MQIPNLTLPYSEKQTLVSGFSAAALSSLRIKISKHELFYWVKPSLGKAGFRLTEKYDQKIRVNFTRYFSYYKTNCTQSLYVC
jgi:hypothetical protein